MSRKYNFYEFFAGGGMARAGLGDNWTCLFANDFDAKKGMSYSENWGSEHLKVEDVAKIKANDLPGMPDLAWASFPCQDLSLAGAGAGLKGNRSGTFWPFWSLMQALMREHRAPHIVVLENVCGALSSHEGKDFAAIGEALTQSGYRFGALVIDAVHFIPQSRPRLFIVAVHESLPIKSELLSMGPKPIWHPANLMTAYQKLSKAAKEQWLWWNLPEPPKRGTVFADLLEDNPTGVTWHSPKETKRLLELMSSLNREKVEKAKAQGHRMVGTIYRRTRIEHGERIQRAEIRFDDIAGCLRTPTGGSSRQVIMIVEGSKVTSRLLSPREAARLMGLPDSYKLPKNYNETYHLAGDGLVVPVVRFLAENILEPLLQYETLRKREIA
jgi:DNA (cytosine-5)-methyltransferase 1